MKRRLAAGGIVKPPTGLGDTVPMILSQGCQYLPRPRPTAEERAHTLAVLAELNRALSGGES